MSEKRNEAWGCIFACFFCFVCGLCIGGAVEAEQWESALVDKPDYIAAIKSKCLLERQAQEDMEKANAKITETK